MFFAYYETFRQESYERSEYGASLAQFIYASEYRIGGTELNDNIKMVEP